MHFGFIQYLENQRKSQETREGYLKPINMFFHFIDENYGKQKEIHQINPKDIKDFIQYKLNAGNEVTTINKHLSVLKSFFDYLWQQGKAPVNPGMKIKSYKGGEEKAYTLKYEMLLDILPDVLKNPEYPALRKAIFILALKGIRNADFRILKSNILREEIRWTIEEIAFSLGIESNSAVNLIKVNQERHARGQVKRNG